MLIVSLGYHSLTYLSSYLLISRRYRVLTWRPRTWPSLEAKDLALALKVVALTPSLIPIMPCMRASSVYPSRVVRGE